MSSQKVNIDDMKLYSRSEKELAQWSKQLIFLART